MKRRGVTVLVVIAIGTLLGIVLLRPPLVWVFLIQVLAIIIVLLGVVFALRPNRAQGLEARAIVFVLVLVLAGVIAFVSEGLSKPQFDFAAIRFKDQSSLAGYYVTTTSSAVLLITYPRAQDPSRCPLDNNSRPYITAVPNSLIQRIAIGPPQVTVRPTAFCSTEAGSGSQRIALNTEATGVVAPSSVVARDWRRAHGLSHRHPHGADADRTGRGWARVAGA